MIYSKENKEELRQKESNYYITENPSGVSIRLKSNNRVIRRIVLNRDHWRPDKPDAKFANTGRVYPETIEECYKEAQYIIQDLDKRDSYGRLPAVTRIRYPGELARHRFSAGHLSLP